MKQSKLFTSTIKDVPKDETSYNAQALIRAGFIDKSAAGVYSYLPLGWRVLGKIEQIIREEMEAIGGQEINMPALAPKENWQKTGRWESLDILFKIKASDNREYALNPTHEEVITPLAQKFVFSYRELPFSVFQIQTKFRNEKRAKAGLLRGREFLMKDLYSFHESEEDLSAYYKLASDAYKKIFARIGLGEITYLTYASGGSFSKYSHEFQTLSESGEDKIYLCSKCNIAVNKEIIESQNSCPECSNENLEEKKAIEVGNIFELKTRFSEAFGLNFQNKNGEKKPVMMGCYGIGLSRLMGAAVEASHDESGIIWPNNIAPYQIHLLSLNEDEETGSLYEMFKQNGFEVLYDDRDISAGQKFADSDLIGCPYRLVVSAKTIAENSVELKRRDGKLMELVKLDNLIDYLKNIK